MALQPIFRREVVFQQLQCSLEDFQVCFTYAGIVPNNFQTSKYKLFSLFLLIYGKRLQQHITQWHKGGEDFGEVVSVQNVHTASSEVIEENGHLLCPRTSGVWRYGAVDVANMFSVWSTFVWRLLDNHVTIQMGHYCILKDIVEASLDLIWQSRQGNRGWWRDNGVGKTELQTWAEAVALFHKASNSRSKFIPNLHYHIFKIWWLCHPCSVLRRKMMEEEWFLMVPGGYWVNLDKPWSPWCANQRNMIR